MGEIRTHDIIRLPVEAVSANEKITFVKNVVLPGERKYTIFFLFARSSICLCQSDAPPKLIIFKLEADCGGRPQEEALLSKDASRYPKFWRNHIGASLGGAAKRKRT